MAGGICLSLELIYAGYDKNDPPDRRRERTGRVTTMSGLEILMAGRVTASSWAGVMRREDWRNFALAVGLGWIVLVVAAYIIPSSNRYHPPSPACLVPLSHRVFLLPGPRLHAAARVLAERMPLRPLALGLRYRRWPLI